MTPPELPGGSMKRMTKSIFVVREMPAYSEAPALCHVLRRVHRSGQAAHDQPLQLPVLLHRSHPVFIPYSNGAKSISSVVSNGSNERSSLTCISSG